MSALLQLGLVDVRTGLLLCAATSGIGVLLFARARPAPAALPTRNAEGLVASAR